jgi:soluble lytic murein transglycosylase-like protein
MYEGNLNRALAAYNAGPERVKENIPNIRETKNYIKAVIEYYNAFSKHEDEEGF